MASYSVAVTKDCLSSLIDKALAGEEVVITRRGKPMVELRAVQPDRVSRDIGAATARLRARLEGKPGLAIPSAHFREWLYEDYKY